MPSISSCPACHRDLTIPDLADRQQPLRCPLCDAQFPAEKVLADCVNFPPAAIVVGTEPSPGAAANSVEQAPRYTLGEEPLARTSGASAWPPDALSSLSATEGPAAAGEEPSGPATSRHDESHEIALLGSAAREPAESSSGVAESGGPPGRVPGEAATDSESFDRQVASMRVAPKTRRQTSTLGALGQLLGMALGGVLGLAIGYYVLLWIGGPRADFLELRGKLPHWLLPARRHNVADETQPLSTLRAGPSDKPPRSLADLVDAPASSETSASAADKHAGDDDQLPKGVAASDARQAAPPAIDPFTAAPKPLPDGYLGPRGFKLRSAAELEAALERADIALRCPHCQRPGAVRLAAFDAPVAGPHDGGTEGRCDYCRGKPMLNVTTATFEDLCALAEAVTFVRLGSGDPFRSSLRDAAETILMAIGSQRDKSEIVGRLAGGRLDDGRRHTNGIIVAGTVQHAQPEGEFFAIQLLLFGCGKSVTVVSRHPPQPPVARRDRLMVLGSIVDGPAKNLVGYTGDLGQVVWGGLHLKLAAAAPY